jgi:hypothetical protein
MELTEPIALTVLDFGDPLPQRPRRVLIACGSVGVLDLPYAAVTMPRVLLRTLRRRVRREVLWNGNTEPPLRTFFTDPEHVVRWSFSTRKKYRVEVPDLEKSRPELSVVRLRSPRQVERWLAGPLASAVR